MSSEAAMLRLPASTLKVLAAAPHRLMFFIGASNVLLAMCWWTHWLIQARWPALGFNLAQPTIPAGWLHATIMQYHVLPSFMFGFLLTVFPRWMSLPALDRKHYVPVGVGLLGGQLTTLLGLALGKHGMLQIGAALTFAGWFIGTLLLVRLVAADRGRTWHAVSCAFALSYGLIGLGMYSLYLVQPDARFMFASIKIGTWAVLLPIYFTVCHRMIPFFASCVVPNYQPVRPMWTLAAFWAGAVAHAWLELRHGYALLWIADLPLAALTAWLAWVWWPRSISAPPILRVLFAGLLWLPIAFALFGMQSLWLAATDEFVLGRAPAHALFIGFFGSLLVAMVTRVTQGHSGRPLVLGRIAAFAFIAIQFVAVARIVAEVRPDTWWWQAIAGIGWIAAFLPWVLRSAWIYLTPRIDGKAG